MSKFDYKKYDIGRGLWHNIVALPNPFSWKIKWNVFQAKFDYKKMLSLERMSQGHQECLKVIQLCVLYEYAISLPQGSFSYSMKAVNIKGYRYEMWKVEHTICELQNFMPSVML